MTRENREGPDDLRPPAGYLGEGGPEALEVPIERLAHAAGLPLPAYASAGAAGMDLLAAIPAEAPLELVSWQRVLVPTGIRLALPAGVEAQIRPRSGLALRHGLTVLNSPGTVDADYRGEVGVVLANLSNEPFRVERGMRIAQLVVARCLRVSWAPVEAEGLEASARGTGGFGSTGVAQPATRVEAGTAHEGRHE